MKRKFKQKIQHNKDDLPQETGTKSQSSHNKASGGTKTQDASAKNTDSQGPIAKDIRAKDTDSQGQSSQNIASNHSRRKYQARLSSRSLLFYVAIFLCMLLFESQRFGLYFERKSTEISEFAPELVSLSTHIEDIALFSGLQASTEITRNALHELSSDYPIQTSTHFFTQYRDYFLERASFFSLDHLNTIDFFATRRTQLEDLQAKKEYYLTIPQFPFSERLSAFVGNQKDRYIYEIASFTEEILAYPLSWFHVLHSSFVAENSIPQSPKIEEALPRTQSTIENATSANPAQQAQNLQENKELHEKENNAETASLETSQSLATPPTQEISQTFENSSNESFLIAQKQEMQEELAEAEEEKPLPTLELEQQNLPEEQYSSEQQNLAEQQNPSRQQNFAIAGSKSLAETLGDSVNAEASTSVTANAEASKPVTENTAIISPALTASLDENISQALLEEDILENSQTLHTAQEKNTAENSNQDTNRQDMDRQDSNSVLERTLQSPYLVYDASHSRPAPTKNALPEYETRIPDFGIKQRVLLIGDSMMMEGLGPSLQALLRKRPDLEVTRLGRYSSGLSRPDFYNWPESLAKLEEKHHPDLIIISLGANDTQDIVIDKKRYFIDTKAWEEIYKERTYDLLYQATLSDKADTLKKAREVVWISLPIMYFEKYAGRTRLISQIQEEVVSHFDNAKFINIEHLLTNEKGEYTNFIKDPDTSKSIRLRREDNIHVTDVGGDILAEYVTPFIDERLKALRIASVQNTNRKLAQKNEHNAENIASDANLLGANTAYAADSLAQQEQPISSILPPVAGQANRVLFSSQARNKEVEYYIYLPEPIQTDTLLAPKTPYVYDILNNSEEKQERFPVLYLLQGSYEENAQFWNEYVGKDLQAIANEERVIIVAPFCEPFGWYVNAPSEIKVSENRSIAHPHPFLQIETFIVEELVPHIDALYPSNKKRALAGISMGGHGAMLLGFKHPKLFSSVASLSGVLDIRLHEKQWYIKDTLGELAYNPQNWEDNSVNALIGKKWQAYAPKQMLIFTGTEDLYVLDDNRKARDLLLQRQYDFEYAEATGEHDWDFWSVHLPMQLRKQATFLHSLD